MSRAMNLQLNADQVRLHCDAGGISISAIEPLPGGGTHLVCTTPAGPDHIRELLSDDLIEGTVKRFPFYRGEAPW